MVVVKGKTQPVAIYEVLDFYEEEEFPNVMDVVNHFNSAVKHYRKQSGIERSRDSSEHSPLIQTTTCVRPI